MKKSDKEGQFPGYPHYPEGEDIMNVPGAQKINVPSGGSDAGDQRNSDEAPAAEEVTDEDRAALSAAFQNRDMDDPDAEEAGLDTTDADGDPLNERQGSYGKAGNDLDVPGSEDDDAAESRGMEDEENNYYSLGGDNHNDLDEEA